MHCEQGQTRSQIHVEKEVKIDVGMYSRNRTSDNTNVESMGSWVGFDSYRGGITCGTLLIESSREKTHEQEHQ